MPETCADDEQPRGSCPICTRRDPRVGRVCEPCRDWQPLALTSIAEKWSDALALLIPAPEPDERTTVNGRPHYDPIGAHLTAGPAEESPFDARVSGSRDPATPLDLDLHDLLGGVVRDGGRDFDVTGDNWVPKLATAPRTLWVDNGTKGRRKTTVQDRWPALDRRGRRVMVPAGDQVGVVPVSQILDQEVRAWRDVGAPGSRFRPAPSVPVMAGWLADRLWWAFERYEPIDTFAEVVRLVRGRLMAALGEFDPPPEPCIGVQCKRCDKRMLFRTQDGSGDVECQNPDCMKVYGQEEYADWARHLGEFERSQRSPEEVRELLFGGRTLVPALA
jgi:hypothetical protein